MESLFGWSDNMVLLMTLPLVFGDVMAIFFMAMTKQLILKTIGRLMHIKNDK